jgi:hypothetical protein
VGKTLTKILKHDDEQLRFFTNDGDEYVMFHLQDCCEYVYLEDICGDLADLINSPILFAREETHENQTPADVNPPNSSDSFTWTFYRIGTIKGTVVLRWLGESNGYYSESVDFREACREG